MAAQYEALMTKASGLSANDFSEPALDCFIGRVAGIENAPLPAEWARWEFAIACSILLSYSHRSNLQRLWQGNENRFEKARIIGRLFSPKRG